MRRGFKSSRLVFPLAALLGLSGALTCAQAAETSGAPTGKESSVAQCGFNAECKDVLSLQRDLRTEMKNDDAQLNKLLATENKAAGTQKIDAVAAIVNKLVADREQTHRQMLAIQSEIVHQVMGSPAVRPKDDHSGV
ncbi:MAG TPA: hypothetical protein VMH30_08605 [Verrucomicrobiae bacterium]|nr:hypothetical protein [Verrucomicrobiae bacterium]